MSTKFFYFLGHEQFQPEVLVKHALIAEQFGFDGVAVSEHFNPWVYDVGSSGFAFTTLGAIAEVTSKIELMTTVVTPLFRYHPAVVAQAAATIDRLSKGRFILGVGTGERINEAPLGYQFPSYKERSLRMKEALFIITRLLAGEKVSYQGKFYQVNAKLYSPPYHKVPIYLAAGGEKSAILATESADGIIISVKNINEAKINILDPARDHAFHLKKELVTVASRWSVFAKNKDEAKIALRAWRGLRSPSRSQATDPKQLQKEADEIPFEEILSRFTIASSSQELINIYLPLVNELKAKIVVINITGNNQDELIKMLGREVLPELKI